jgi:hypothetical protein
MRSPQSSTSTGPTSATASGLGWPIIAITTLEGPLPAGFGDPPPNPADFGLPTEDDGICNDPMLGGHIVACTHYEHDFDALQVASTRIIIGAGAESKGTFTHRAALGSRSPSDWDQKP